MYALRIPRYMIAALLAYSVFRPLMFSEGWLQAQTPPATLRPGDGGSSGDITPASVQRSLTALTTGPMTDRRLGTAGLARAADYVAAEFQRVGLTVDTQRFVLPEHIVLNNVTVDFAVRLRVQKRPILSETGGPIQYDANASLAAATARPALDTIAESGCLEMFAGAVTAAMPVLTGRQTVTTARAAAVRGTTVFYVPSPGTDSATREAVIRELAVDRAVIIVSDEDSATFARRAAIVTGHSPVVVQRAMERMSTPRRCAAYVTPASVAHVFALAGADLAAWRADTVPQLRAMPSVGAKIHVDAGHSPTDTIRGVNLVAKLAGSDSTLRQQPPLVIVAHLDTDSTAPSADDNASGVAGVLALAEAFAQPGAQPKRSLTFVVTTGTRRDAAGINTFVTGGFSNSAVYIDGSAIGGLVLEMLGSGPADSLVIAGLQEIELPISPRWVTAKHPELDVSVADGGTVTAGWSDNAGLVAAGVPTLLLYGATHRAAEGDAGSKAARTAADRIDPELVARRLRLVYAVTRELAMSSQGPRWTVIGRRRRGN